MLCTDPPGTFHWQEVAALTLDNVGITFSPIKDLVRFKTWLLMKVYYNFLLKITFNSCCSIENWCEGNHFKNYHLGPSSR